MLFKSRTARFRGLSSVLVGLVLVLLVVQAGRGQEGTGGRKDKRGQAWTIDLVVDTVVKRSWTWEDAGRLPTTKLSDLRAPRERVAITLSTFLKEGGVNRDAIRELRIVNQRNSAVTLKGDDLTKIDQLGFAPAVRGLAKRPLRLVPLDPSFKAKGGAYELSGVRRIEVVTTGGSK